jgi:hypothetical protein
VGNGLGSHDPGVAVVAVVELFEKAMFPWMVFTGANAPTTVDRFPRGEAVHYREYAIEHGGTSSTGTAAAPAAHRTVPCRRVRRR